MTPDVWQLMKDLGIILNYLLIPIGAVAFKGFKLFIRIDRRVTRLELLHELKGCHIAALKDLDDEDN